MSHGQPPTTPTITEKWPYISFDHVGPMYSDMGGQIEGQNWGHWLNHYAYKIIYILVAL
jgi:hypothetical protein